VVTFFVTPHPPKGGAKNKRQKAVGSGQKENAFSTAFSLLPSAFCAPGGAQKRNPSAKRQRGSKFLWLITKGHPEIGTASNDCLPYEKKLISFL